MIISTFLKLLIKSEYNMNIIIFGFFDGNKSYNRNDGQWSFFAFLYNIKYLDNYSDNSWKEIF